MRLAKILVIEDDYIVARTIERSLRTGKYQIMLASRGDKGLSLAHREIPDLVILDIIMPDMDGYAVCNEMRADPDLALIPILFLTAKTKPTDRIAGFRSGADDYLCKPFNVDELALRVKVILRRTLPVEVARYVCGEEEQAVETPSGDGHLLAVGDFSLDTRSFELTTPHRGVIRLTPLQFDLLYHLMTHPGVPFSPSRLLDEVWDYPFGRGSTDLVRVHIKTLRERIELNPQAPSFLCTVPGKGYMVQAPRQISMSSE
jgi:DNA-binding response OmpR family regulator